MNQDLVLSLVRHALTAAGSILVTKGVIDAGSLDAAIGALITLGSVGWMLATRKRAQPDG